MNILQNILRTYGAEDLGKASNFQGGFINFGYWKKIPFTSNLSIAQRIQASKALYHYVFHRLNPKPEDLVIELGCGRGLGCNELAEQYSVKKIIGVDLSPEQIARAKKNILYPHIDLLRAPAESLPLKSNSIDCLFSVEAAQHFISMHECAKEMKRILKVGGHFVLVAHLSTSLDSLNAMIANNWMMLEGIDNLTPIENVLLDFKAAGMTNIISHSIGKDVFPGYDQWLQQTPDSNPWARNLYKSYKLGYLDYYCIEGYA